MASEPAPHTFQGKRGDYDLAGLTMRQVYEIVREKLNYFHPARSDPDAFCQDMCCLMEKALGIYPNVPSIGGTNE